MSSPEQDRSLIPRSRFIALALCLFLGIFGAHRFYVGRWKTGLAMVLTLGLFGLWALVDLLVILFGSFRECDGEYLDAWFVQSPFKEGLLAACCFLFAVSVHMVIFIAAASVWLLTAGGGVAPPLVDLLNLPRLVEPVKQAPAPSGIVRYVDGQGRAVYVDRLSKVPEQYRSSVNPDHKLPPITRTDFVVKSRGADAPHRTGAAAAGGRRVEIFVTSWCPYCVQLERFLKQHGIPFKRYDIEQDAAGRRIHTELGGGGVPVTRVGTTVVRGFSPQEILDAVKQ